mgnify:CR=1 FL=1
MQIVKWCMCTVFAKVSAIDKSGIAAAIVGIGNGSGTELGCAGCRDASDRQPAYARIFLITY